MPNGFVQNILNAEQDAVSLSDFMLKPANFTVSRRLAPPMNTMNHFLQYFNGISSIYTKESGVVIIDGQVRKTIGQLEIDAKTRVDAAIEASTVDGSLVTDALTKVTPIDDTAVAISQKKKNEDVLSVTQFIPAGTTEHTMSFNLALMYASVKGGGTVHVPDGTFYFDPLLGGIKMRSNTELRCSKNTLLEQTSYDMTDVFQVIDVFRVSDVTLSNININGKKELRKVKGKPDGTYYRDFRGDNPVVEVGDFVYGFNSGFEVVTAGTCDTWSYDSFNIFRFANTETNLQTTPVYFQSGTATLRYIEKGLSEFGMGICIRGSKNVTMRDVNVLDCWGDGIFIGRSGGAYFGGTGASYSENVIMDNVYIDGCRRQGISVVSLKRGRFNNVTIHDIGGTAPEAAIDFEPDYVDELLEDIIIKNLKTTGTRTAGCTAYLSALYTAVPDFDMQGYEQASLPADKPIEQKQHYIAKAVEASKNRNKISITINDWENDSADGFHLYGTGNTTKLGHITINDSSITYSGTSLERGCVSGIRTFADSPTLNIKDTDLVNNTTNALSHIWISKPVIGDKPLGGIHLDNVKFYSPKPINPNIGANIFISDPFKNTDNFQDISIVDCEAFPKNQTPLLAVIGTLHTAKRGRNIRIVDTIDGNSRVLPEYSGAALNIWEGGEQLKVYRPNSAKVEYLVRYSKFPYGGGVEMTLSNELCEVGSGKLLVVQIPHGATLTNLPKNSWNKALDGGFETYQELVVPTGSALKLKMIDASNAEITHMDEATARATWSRKTVLTILPSAAVTIAAGEEYYLSAIQPPNILDDMQYVVATTGMGALNLETTRDKTVFKHVIRNPTLESKTWSGSIFINPLR